MCIRVSDSFLRTLSPIYVFITDHSSPTGIGLDPDAITFSTTVEPHLGTPTIKIGFALLTISFLLMFSNSFVFGKSFNQ